MKQTKMMLRDERGSTLIEIIVSVLIVGIAFVPLMMGLTSALTTNKMTENQLYAENVASNVVEICKTYGANGLMKLAGSGESISGAGTYKIDRFFEGKDASHPPVLTEESMGAKTKFKIEGIKAFPS